jgi:hypothetical protein
MIQGTSERADVVLSSHEHNYERFAPEDPEGKADPERGIREFVVGTGGKSHYEILDPLPDSEVHNDETFGVLKLILHPKSYEWRFLPAESSLTLATTTATSGHRRQVANFHENATTSASSGK